MGAPGGARSTFSIEHSDVSVRGESANWPHRHTSADWIACGPGTCAVIVRAPRPFRRPRPRCARRAAGRSVSVPRSCRMSGRRKQPPRCLHGVSCGSGPPPFRCPAVVRAGGRADLQALRPRLANVAAGFADRSPGMAGNRSHLNEPRRLEDLSHRLGMRRRIGCGQTVECGRGRMSVPESPFSDSPHTRTGEDYSESWVAVVRTSRRMAIILSISHVAPVFRQRGLSLRSVMDGS